jgi:hypothetical protein
LLGWVDDAEFTKLTRSLLERYKLIRSIKTVEASTPREIFENISWMGDDKHLIDYLYDNVVIKKFDPGNVVVKEGTITEGIYILISGKVFISTSLIKKLHTYVQLGHFKLAKASALVRLCGREKDSAPRLLKISRAVAGANS